MALTRDQILQANDIPTREVDCPEWGGSVLVRALSLKEVNEWRRSMLVESKTKDKFGNVKTDLTFNQSAAELANAEMLAIAIVDEQGKRVFAKEDVAALSAKHPAPLERLVKVVMEISGLTPTAAEDAEKN